MNQLRLRCNRLTLPGFVACDEQGPWAGAERLALGFALHKVEAPQVSLQIAGIGMAHGAVCPARQHWLG